MPTKTSAKPAAVAKAAPEKMAAKVNGTALRKRKVEDEPEVDGVIESPKPKKTKTVPLKEASTNGTTKPKAESKSKAEPKRKAQAKPKTKTKTPEPTAVSVEEAPRKVEPPKKTAPPKAARKTVSAKKTIASDIGDKINTAPTQQLDIFVFGEGSSGELGLGSKRVDGKKPIDVKRPRLNQNLAAQTVGVVQIACGGMHVAALTHDNKILTWGVNDQGALGRDTTWDGGLRDMDKEDGSDDDDDDDDTGINPLESTPTAVASKHFPDGAKFVQVVASDSATFALTEDGRVYGWGTFRSSDGILGFTEKIKVQPTPMLMPDLKNVKALAAGSNHILALDNKGIVVAWGAGQQNQLGRRIIERNKKSSLVPQGLGFPRNKVERIACGSYHSFALDKDGNVWGWGLNNFGETGIRFGAGDDEAAVLKPTIVEALKKFKITDIAGGEHHSLACADDGTLLTWGRVDGHQVGIPWDELTEENTIYDERGHARILFRPTAVEDVKDVVAVAAGTDNNFAITRDGKAYSWGFSGNYQTGQGTIEDIETPTVVDNTAVRGKKIVAAGAGGQYSVLIGIPDTPLINGVH